MLNVVAGSLLEISLRRLFFSSLSYGLLASLLLSLDLNGIADGIFLPGEVSVV